MHPLVSIVVPSCDRCNILRECLDALARQSWPNYEIIVVDDCSADETQSMLAEWQVSHPGVSLCPLRNECHLGANPSRNRGVEAAAGEFVAFLDSDCLAQPEWLEKLLREFTHANVAGVTGCVEEPPPRNIYELTFKGTNRVHYTGPARRLVAGNMCIRRSVLRRITLDEDRAPVTAVAPQGRDTTVSGRGDEEGLCLELLAAGYELRSAPDGIVLHVHPLSGRAFFRQALRGGRSAARLVYKYRLAPRLDMLPFMLAYATLPLAALVPYGFVAPAGFFLAALGAITYNDLARKGKTLREVGISFPMLLVYYHVRLAGYVSEAVRLRCTKTDLKRVRLPRSSTSQEN